MSDFKLKPSEQEILGFFRNSSFLQKANLLNEVNKISFRDNKLIFNDIEMNSYLASVLADFLRQKLIQAQKSFTFETVMSSYDKIQLLKEAQNLGFRTYLYFVATDNPFINITRVTSRVKSGGHGVPEEKIKERYQRSLDFLLDAIRYSNRAYIFDNSGLESIFLAEFTDGGTPALQTKEIPAWFKRAVLDKIQPN